MPKTHNVIWHEDWRTRKGDWIFLYNSNNAHSCMVKLTSWWWPRTLKVTASVAGCSSTCADHEMIAAERWKISQEHVHLHPRYFYCPFPGDLASARDENVVWMKKSENIGLPIELGKSSWQKRDSIETLVFYFRWFPLFLKAIKIEPVTELPRVASFVKLAQ